MPFSGMGSDEPEDRASRIVQRKRAWENGRVGERRTDDPVQSVNARSVVARGRIDGRRAWKSGGAGAWGHWPSLRSGRTPRVLPHWQSGIASFGAHPKSTSSLAIWDCRVRGACESEYRMGRGKAEVAYVPLPCAQPHLCRADRQAGARVREKTPVLSCASAYRTTCWHKRV
jgi:hypothetical protein